ncbi:hypothetical protein [Sphingobium sp. CR28]|uniref:hypothetical protein n=1 Tax=Sphingobium sp. CR28 TaxID=3400272 RepID=UPI003FF0ECCB
MVHEHTSGFSSLKRGKAAAVATCSLLAMLLSACETTGGTRFSGVGAPPSGSDGSGGGSGGGGNSGGGSNNGGGSGGGSGGNGSGNGNGGGSGSATQAGLIAGTLQEVSPVLVTAGNAVLGVSNGQGQVTTPVATALPLAQPVTGTITRVLNDTGTVLVDAGQGRTLLLQGAQGVVGDVLSIDVGSNSVITGLDGTPGAVGVGVLGNSQPVGTVASVGVLNAGNTVLANVGGVADVRVTNITAPTGGIADNLLNVAVGGNQLLGSGNPALLNANVLPGGLPTAGGANGVLAPVTNALGTVTGGTGTGVVSGVVSSVQQGTGDLLGSVGVGAGASADAGASSGGLLAPVTGVVNVATGANAGADGSAASGGLLAPVTGVVSNLGGALGLGNQ